MKERGKYYKTIKSDRVSSIENSESYSVTMLTKIIKLDEAPTKSSRDMNGNMILLSKEIGTKGCNAVIIIKEPGVSDKPLLHYHHKREELFIVLEGRAIGVVNGEEMILEPGMAFLAPAGDKHYFHLRARPLNNAIFKMIEVGSPIDDETIVVEEK